MELQNKINQRIEQLEAELEKVREEYNKVNENCAEDYFVFNYGHQLDELEWRLECVSRCIKELKSLLNN